MTQVLAATPLTIYQKDLERADFSYDESQAEAVNKLQALHGRLNARYREQQGWFSKISKLLSPPTPVKGLYFWGGVGRGKTYLVDTFYESLPFKEKKRLHFHRFMHGVHQQLKHFAGENDPLDKIAENMAENTLVICFDEFFVTDITDAMILGGLFKALFAQGVSLVATSNIPPEKLYWNGLQRERFLPAIKLVQQHCEVFNLDGGIDYRLRTLEQAEIFHHPLDQAATDNLTHSFDSLVKAEQISEEPLEIEGRRIDIERMGEGVVWFNFDVICNTPRSHADYIELSKLFQTVLVGDMPQLADDQNDAARRFISLVDEFYERNVKLMLAAAKPLEELYIGKGLAFEFKRTLSRLQEMQSREYLAKPHLP